MICGVWLSFTILAGFFRTASTRQKANLYFFACTSRIRRDACGRRLRREQTSSSNPAQTCGKKVRYLRRMPPGMNRHTRTFRGAIATKGCGVGVDKIDAVEPRHQVVAVFVLSLNEASHQTLLADTIDSLGCNYLRIREWLEHRIQPIGHGNAVIIGKQNYGRFGFTRTAVASRRRPGI